MHAWIYQISDSPIEEFINEDTLNQGDGTDYDYCAEISVEERKEAVKTLLENILPLDMFKQVDDKAFDYVGGIEEWKRQWVQRIQQKAYRGMTEDDANEIRSILQTQCNNRDYEWEFEAQQINAFAG